MQKLWDAADFVRKFRMRLRFGDLSRANLKLLRLELTGGAAECDWIARAADPWDETWRTLWPIETLQFRPWRIRWRCANCCFTRCLVFPRRVCRFTAQTPGADTELIIEGVVSRDEPPDRKIRSLAMRARLCGLHFWLDDGVLLAMQTSVAR